MRLLLVLGLLTLPVCAQEPPLDGARKFSCMAERREIIVVDKQGKEVRRETEYDVTATIEYKEREPWVKLIARRISPSPKKNRKTVELAERDCNEWMEKVSNDSRSRQRSREPVGGVAPR